MYACLAVTCHLHISQNDRSLLRATAVTRGWNGHRAVSYQYTKLTLERKIRPLLLPGFELATFRLHVCLRADKIATHLKQRPCCQRGSPCQDPGGNRTTRRPPDHRKETQTAVVWSCPPFIRSSQNHLAGHSEKGKKTRQTDRGRGGKTTSGNGQAWSSTSPRWQWRTE